MLLSPQPACHLSVSSNICKIYLVFSNIWKIRAIFFQSKGQDVTLGGVHCTVGLHPSLFTGSPKTHLSPSVCPSPDQVLGICTIYLIIILSTSSFSFYIYVLILHRVFASFPLFSGIPTTCLSPFRLPVPCSSAWNRLKGVGWVEASVGLDVTG